eukprot:CAMPEP_0185197376 /NCGR_PEP_ID=MMETSP1140-20130426/40249_1 /TAXON_ID=298111 /ORGANISM="Pavlova sp., Strain CCMP459" /LENGTH=130 /DNA_ID=CAMNT_0027764487 /DNA_START=240 /DNA_END=633 /DNA_ORIENTATION=-
MARHAHSDHPNLPVPHMSAYGSAEDVDSRSLPASSHGVLGDKGDELALVRASKFIHLSSVLVELESGHGADATLAAVSEFSSTSTLRHTIVSLCSLASASKTGAIILQGPHQLAVKSTTTSLSPALVKAA